MFLRRPKAEADSGAGAAFGKKPKKEKKEPSKKEQQKPKKLKGKGKKSADGGGGNALFPKGMLVVTSQAAHHHNLLPRTTLTDCLRLQWAKVGHYPYWPAKVIEVDEVADEKARKQLTAAQKKKTAIKDAVLVMFFQSLDCSWIKPDRGKRTSTPHHNLISSCAPERDWFFTVVKFTGPGSSPESGKKGSGGDDLNTAVEEAVEQMESNADWERDMPPGKYNEEAAYESSPQRDSRDVSERLLCLRSWRWWEG